MIINVIDKQGRSHFLEGTAGETLMSALRDLPEGVEAACGGAMACATCHVYVSEPWNRRLPASTENERELLDLLMHDEEARSRLSCQIVLAEDLDGIEITIAPDE